MAAAEGGETEVEESEPVKRHTLAALVRYVSEGRAGGGPAVGLEYEYLLREKWGLGAFGEWVAGDIETAVIGVTANYHPIEELAIVFGPGVELNEEEELWIGRLGAAYEFEVGKFFIAPAAYVDWIEGGDFAVLAGLNFAIKF